VKFALNLHKNGDLAKRIKLTEKEGKQFEEIQIFSWSIQATTALKYLHKEKKIAHRDIKPG
jgi:serine/threonine protein kinase